jgi:colicin import membrane protein
MPQPAPYVGSPRYPVTHPDRPAGDVSNGLAQPVQQAPAPAPVQLTPAQDKGLALAPAAPRGAAYEPTPAPVAPAAKIDPKAAKKAAEERRAAEKKAAKEKAEADRKAAEEAARQKKLDDARAKREAEIAKKNAEAERRRQEELKKQNKALNEAAERLRQAQAAYQAEIDKKKTIKK